MDAANIRDESFRAAFEAKMAEIEEVRAQNTYLAYATNRHLFSEMEALLSRNLQAYEENYAAPLRQFHALQSILEARKEDMHRLRLQKAQSLIAEIEAALEVEDYNRNADAKDLIQRLQSHLDSAQEEFTDWNQKLADWRMRLKEVMTQLWSEDYAPLKAHYQAVKEQIQGERIPTEAVMADETAIAEGISRKHEDLEELRGKLSWTPGLRKKVDDWEEMYETREAFDAFSARLISARKRHLWLRSLIMAVVIAAGSFALWYVPQLDAAQKDQDAWQVAQSTHTVASYDRYLAIYPSGAYADSAQKARLAIDDGPLPNLTNALGQSFDYEGDIAQTLPNGRGKAIYEDSSVYEGDWLAGKRHGQGILTRTDTSQYEGEWTDDQPNGKGIETRADGSRYQGNWRKGLYSGWGVKAWADSSNYRGGWVAGQPSGKGLFHFSDGRIYEGGFKEGVFHGTGKLNLPDGTVYEGKWEMGQKSGQGVMNWVDGSRFEGVWRNDSLAGSGTFTNRFREQRSGRWHGTPNSILLTDQAGIQRRGRWEGGMFIEQ
ncbi:MAG: hypothetical protein AAF206_23120 [Bacteroidota bacterium]